MQTAKKKGVGRRNNHIGADFIERMEKESWAYLKTVVDIVREPILILDKDLRVIASNEPFCRTFQIEPKDIENEVVYELGNGQWDIPDLRRLLEDILPTNTFFKGFEVTHDFPLIGRKVMILNARQIYCPEDTPLKPCPPIILLAMEDVTEMMMVAETLAGHANQVAADIAERTQKLEIRIRGLEREIHGLKQRP